MTTLCIPRDNVRNSLEQDPAIVARESLRSRSPNAPRLSIRNTSAWYPDVRSDGAHMNEKHYKGSCQADLREFPLYITMFGGSQGAELSNLVGITGWTLNGVRVLGIGFEYRDRNGNAFHHEFGRCGPFTLEEYLAMRVSVGRRLIYRDGQPEVNEDAIDDDDLNQKVHFDIDGAGGGGY